MNLTESVRKTLRNHRRIDVRKNQDSGIICHVSKAESFDRRISVGVVVTSARLLFASNLRRMLHERGITAAALAEQLNVSTAIVTHWRNADKFPGPENLDGLARVFKCDLTEFFRSDVDPNPSATLLDAQTAFRFLAGVFHYDVKSSPSNPSDLVLVHRDEKETGEAKPKRGRKKTPKNGAKPGHG